MRKKRLIWAAAAVLLIAAAVLPGLDSRLTVRRYAVVSEKVSAHVRLAVVSDLHSCSHPELVPAIAAEEPDLVLLCGDIFDEDLPEDNAREILCGIADRYPTYFVTGNHEYMGAEGSNARMMSIADEAGVIRLSDEYAEPKVNGTDLLLYGVDDPACAPNENAPEDFEKRLTALSQTLPEDRFTVLLSHRPVFADLYAEFGYDLVLSGHEHGGQWRVPGLVNGLFCPDEGLFPKYAGGRYEIGDTVMIVSRGLATGEAVFVPRLYNPCELVIVDICPPNER